MLARVKSLWRDEEGQGMVEYGLIIAAIAVVVGAVLWAVGVDIAALFTGLDFGP